MQINLFDYFGNRYCLANHVFKFATQATWLVSGNTLLSAFGNSNSCKNCFFFYDIEVKVFHSIKKQKVVPIKKKSLQNSKYMFHNIGLKNYSMSDKSGTVPQAMLL